MVMETYYRKRSKKKPEHPTMEMDQKEAVQLQGCVAPRQQSPPSGFCSLLLQESDFLTPEVDESEVQNQNQIQEGFVYEINHDCLPSITPAHLRSIRVAMVCEKTDVNLAVRYPSMESLRAFFNYSSRESHPALDHKFVMEAAMAERVLVRPVPAEVFSEHKSELGFWLISSVEAASWKGNGVHKEEGGSFLYEALKGNGWGIRRQVKYLGRHKESEGSDVCIPQNSYSSGVEESQIGEKDGDMENGEEEEEEEEKVKVEKSDVNLKRKRYSFRNLGAKNTKKAKLQIRNQKQKQSQTQKIMKKNKGGRKRSRDSLIQRDPKDRWSAERYKLAEQNLLVVMKAKGASAEKPILRPQLRAEARKRIGDTGLLDHLLKHMAGRLAPGGQERFRRRHNTDGAMEYWLEGADLVNIRRDAGVTDPYWVPPPGWRLGDSPTQDPACASQLKLLKDDISEIKICMELMATKMKLMEEVGMLRRKIDEISSKKKQQEIQTVTVESDHCGIGQKLDRLAAASLEFSKRDFSYIQIPVGKYKDQLMSISELLKEIEGKFENTAMAAAVEREKKSTQAEDALTAAAEGKKKTALQLEEKAAKIQRLKSGFRICRPQGTFLWPNMANNSNGSINNNYMTSFVQEVPTPPSVSSSSVPPQLPYGGSGGGQPSPPPSILKPLAVTVTVSTANTPAGLVNLNHAPTNLDHHMPLTQQQIDGSRLPWERAQVGNWLALSTTFKSASHDSSNA